MADAKLIKELRDRTGAGFLDVKKALEASDNDIEKAIVFLQEKGAAKAAKKAGAIAAEGVVKTLVEGNTAVIYEVNSQTDFVASNQQFKDLVAKIGQVLIDNDFNSAEEAQNIKVGDLTIAEICQEATATIGEKIELRRASKINAEVIGAYTHVNDRVAAIVTTEGGTNDIARNVSMHVASMNPLFLDESQVPAEKVASFKEEIAESDAIKAKKDKVSPEVLENITKGMLRKHLSEITLVDQEFVMEKMPVSKYLSSHGAKATSMIRFEVGEGIEKQETDFAAEVAAQMKS